MKLAKHLVNMLVRNNTVREEDREIYDYGIDQIIFTSLNVITMMGIGIITDSLVDIAIFSLFYVTLRVYAGGYHADTQLKCFILSNLMIMIIVAINLCMLIPWLIQIFLVVVSYMVIMRLGPVDTKTRRLDALERFVYQKRMAIILRVEVALFFVFITLSRNTTSKTITLSIVSVMIMLMSGVIHNRRKEAEE
jgi:accessory gene regulator B